MSRNTVLLAFAALAAEGYVETREGSGTYVSDATPEPANFETPPAAARRPAPRPAAKPLCDFKLEAVDPDLFPQATWRRLMMRRIQTSDFNLTRIGDPQGLPELRGALCRFLGASRGMSLDPGQIIIVSSIQQATNVVAQMLVAHGTPVIVEGPGCSLIAPICERAGADILRVPVDAQGMQVVRLPDVKGALVATTPARQFPIGVAMPADRRQALLDWAERCDAHVLEVDFDGDFYYEGSPQASLQAHDRGGRFIYSGSFALTIGPGLRIGYLVLPPNLVQPALAALKLLDHAYPCQGQGGPWLDQAVLTDFIDSGGYDRQLRRLHRAYMQRRDALVARLTRHFGPCDLIGTASGTHLIWQLPDHLPDAAACQAFARAAGISVYTMQLETISGADMLADSARHMLLGYADLDPNAIAGAIDRLAELLI